MTHLPPAAGNFAPDPQPPAAGGPAPRLPDPIENSWLRHCYSTPINKKNNIQYRNNKFQFFISVTLITNLTTDIFKMQLSTDCTDLQLDAFCYIQRYRNSSSSNNVDKTILLTPF